MCPEEVIETKPQRDPRAFNAYRHGLTGQVRIMTPEDQAAYEAHCRGIVESLAPVGHFEADLVHSIADDRWRLNLAAVIDNNTFTRGLNEPDDITTHHPEADAALAQARVWLTDSHKLGLLTLYEARIQRKIEKNLAILRQHQQDRQAALEKAVEEATLLAQLAAAKGESFDIDRDYPHEFRPPHVVFSTPDLARRVALGLLLADAKKRFPAAPKSLRRAA
ncbi:hypothetical protein SBA3_3280013 [Candidatus Sulfopaludibacter sp. SbA3]|nr:hypothetical protein SBA3_3280013 [Candidatus Sulfopaludibacter sp. SbA3]